jgi:hypothetical protein
VAATLFPLRGIPVDELAARARERLGDEAYEAAVAEGRQWPLSEALARTLEDVAS